MKIFDVFSIWMLVLWVIGYSISGKVGIKKSGVTIVILYLIGAGIGIGIAKLTGSIR